MFTSPVNKMCNSNQGPCVSNDPFKSFPKPKRNRKRDIHNNRIYYTIFKRVDPSLYNMKRLGGQETTDSKIQRFETAKH